MNPAKEILTFEMDSSLHFTAMLRGRKQSVVVILELMEVYMVSLVAPYKIPLLIWFHNTVSRELAQLRWHLSCRKFAMDQTVRRHSDRFLRSCLAAHRAKFRGQQDKILLWFLQQTITGGVCVVEWLTLLGLNDWSQLDDIVKQISYLVPVCPGSTSE